MIQASDDTRYVQLSAYQGGNGVTYTGLVGGETPQALGGTLNYGGSAQSARLAGRYQIVPYGLVSDNYRLSYVAGTLTLVDTSAQLSRYPEIVSATAKTYRITPGSTMHSCMPVNGSADASRCATLIQIVH